MIRIATENDLERITDICNQAILEGFKTASVKTHSIEQRKAWFNQFNRETYPIYVYEDDNDVLGWIALSPYRETREALSETAIVSYFVDYEHLGKGIGSQLIEYLIKHLPKTIKVVFAIIIEGNDASIALLRKFGFEEWGLLPAVYNYNDEIRNQIYLGRVFR